MPCPSQPQPNQPHLTDDNLATITSGDRPFTVNDLLANDRIPAQSAHFYFGSDPDSTAQAQYLADHNIAVSPIGGGAVTMDPIDDPFAYAYSLGNGAPSSDFQYSIQIGNNGKVYTATVDVFPFEQGPGVDPSLHHDLII